MNRELTESNRKTKRIKYFDYPLLVIVLFLVAFGLIMVYSTSYYSATLDNLSPDYYLKKQLFATIIGIICMAVVAIIPYRIYKVLSPWAVLISCIMIALVKSPLGHTANGATRWLRIGPISVQPAEIAKVSVILITGYILSILGQKALRSLKAVIIALVPAAVLALLLYKITENLSSAIIVAGIAFCMVCVGTKGNKWPLLFFAVGVLAIAIYVFSLTKGWNLFGSSFRSERVLAWLNPEAYSDGKGFQILQSLYGIGSGGVTGKGLGKSMQKLGFLPEAQNDMIFSIICEELGLVGGLAVMILYILLLWRIRDTASYCHDAFGNLIVTGVFAHFAIQVILNIAVVTNTMPNTGISLPFISYGGTSLIFLLIEVGIVMNVGIHSDFSDDDSVKSVKKQVENKDEEKKATS